MSVGKNLGRSNTKVLIVVTGCLGMVKYRGDDFLIFILLYLTTFQDFCDGRINFEKYFLLLK